MFQCDINDAPVIGILGIVSHRAKVAAKDMYSVFDLNRSQASILLTLITVSLCRRRIWQSS